MSWPDTIEQAAGRHLASIESGAEILAVEPDRYTEDEEQTAFRLAAYAGARAYAEYLRQALEDGSVTDALLVQADLVRTAAHCAGWLSASTARLDREGAMDDLVRQGFFVYHPAVPGRFVAKYRLVPA
jgi:hypothetical protein